MEAPDKVKRKVCWKARDEYWECLNRFAPEHQPASGEKEPKECVAFRKAMETECPAKWVNHFDRRRGYEQYKQKMGLVFPEDEKK